MLFFDKIPEPIERNYTGWKSVRDKFLSDAKKYWDYYFNDVDGTGTLYNKSQLDTIKSYSNLPVSINYIYPTANQELAILAQTKTSHQVISFDGRYKEFAFVLDKMMKAVQYSSRAILQKEEAIKEMLVTGMTHEIIEEMDVYQKGEFGVTHRHLSNEQVIVDCNSTDRSDQDREGFFLEKEITEAKSKELYGSLVMALNKKFGTPDNPITFDNFLGSSYSQNASSRKSVEGLFNTRKLRVREYYDMVYTTMYLVQNPKTGDIIRVFEENLEDEEMGILTATVDKWESRFARRTLILGDKVVEVEVKPVTQLPLKTTYFEYGGKPYKSKGLVHFIIGMQEAYDKSIQLMLVNGMMQNNAKVKSPVGAITDEYRDNWEKYFTDPSKIAEYVPQVIDGKVLVPEREVVQALPNFYIQLCLMMKEGIEYVSTVNPMKAGNPNEGKVEVFSTYQQYQSAAMQRTLLSLGHMQETAEYLGQVLTEYLIANIEPSVNYSFFDDKGKISEVQIAQELAGDMKLGKYKVFSVPGNLMPSQRTALAAEMFKIAQSTGDPIERKVYSQRGMTLSDIPGVDDIQEELNVTKQLQGQVQSISEELKRQMEITKQQENARINAEVELMVMKDYMRATNRLEADGERMKGDMKAKMVEITKQHEINLIKDKQKEKNSQE